MEGVAYGGNRAERLLRDAEEGGASLSASPPSRGQLRGAAAASRGAAAASRGNEEDRRRVASWMWSAVASMFYHLAGWNVFFILLLLKLNEKLMASWIVVCLPIMLLEAIASLQEAHRFMKARAAATQQLQQQQQQQYPNLRSSQQMSMSPYIFAHKEVHAICFCLSIFLVSLRLELIIPESVLWTVLLTPMWVDAILGTVLLWITPPISDNGPSAVDQRRGFFHAGLFHVFFWGIQIVLIALNLDGLLDGAWSNVFCPSFLVLILGVVLLSGTTLHLLVTIFPVVFRFSSVSHAGKIIVLELATIIIVAWSWVICIFRSFNQLLMLLSDLGGDISYTSIILPLILMLSLTMLVIPALVAAALAVGVDEEGLAAATGARSRLSLEPIVDPVTVVRSSSMYFKNVSPRESPTPIAEEEEEEEEEDQENNENPCVCNSNFGSGRDVLTQDVELGLGASHSASEGGGDNAARRICYVCMTLPPNAIILECGHGGICWTCAKSLVEGWERHPACPMCRGKVTSIIRVPEEAMMSDTRGQRFEAEEGIRVRIADR